MTKLLTNPWMNVPLGAIIYLAATLLFWKTPVPPPVSSSDFKPSFNGPSWEFSNPEADLFMNELKDQKKTLAQRQQQLDDLALNLQTRSNEVVAATQTLQNLQKDFDSSVTRVKEDEIANLKKLAKVYADMSPDAAATVMGELDDTVIVKIMINMKESEVAAILEVFAKKGAAEAKRAASISEHVRLSMVARKAGTK